MTTDRRQSREIDGKGSRTVDGAPGLRRFKPYPAYKDSGVEWLGKIPAHWRLLSVKRYIGFTTGWTPPTGDARLYDGDNPWANISDLGPRLLYETQKTISDEAVRQSGIKPSPPGSLLFAFKLSVGAVSIVGREMYTNEAIATFLPAATVDVNYLYWSAPIYVPQNAIENIYGAALLSRDRIAAASLCVPPSLDEQRAIAAFLDRETARIDALVAKKERLIELLQEKRSALITRAVTKGLDPNVPMKDTGVEWLGRFPAHWRLTKMWDVSWAMSGGTPAKEELRYWDGGIPWVSAKDMKRRFIDSTEDTVSDAAVSEWGLKLITPPAVLVVVRGMILAHTFPVAITKVPVTINQDMKALRLRHDLNPVFFSYWLQGVGRELLAVVVEEAAHGTKAIRMDRWRVTPVQVSPQPEQEAIVTFLDRETAKIDALVAKVRDAIGRLEEFRTALISAAVTGKIDVREKVA